MSELTETVVLNEKLSVIQEKLKANKGQFNNFGKYAYRSCEDILEAVKPLLHGVVLTISDEVIEVGGRVYIKATAQFGGNYGVTVSAMAREAESKKGMDDAQVTGAASSYARKYALNGLFCIDDNKDPDHAPQPDNKFENLKLHQSKVREHFSSVSEVKRALGEEQIESAMLAWFEIPKEDRKYIVGVAALNGGIFTTEERKVIGGDEFKARYIELLNNGDEEPTTVESIENEHNNNR